MSNFEHGVPSQESSMRSKEIRDNFTALDARTGKLTPKVLETISTILNVGQGLIYFGDNQFIDFTGESIDLADSSSGVDAFSSAGFWREVLVYLSSTSTKASLITNFPSSNSNLKFIAADAKIGSIGNNISIQFIPTSDPDFEVLVDSFDITFSIPEDFGGPSVPPTAQDLMDWVNDPGENPPSGDLRGLIDEVVFPENNNGTGLIGTTFGPTVFTGGFDVDITQGATLGIISGPEKENLAAIERPDFSRSDFPKFPTDVIPVCCAIVQNNGTTNVRGSINSFTQSSIFDLRGYLNLTRSEQNLNSHTALSVDNAHTGKLTDAGLGGGAITNVKHRVTKGIISGIPTGTTITVSNVSSIVDSSTFPYTPSEPLFVRFVKLSDATDVGAEAGLEVSNLSAIIETREVVGAPNSTQIEINLALDAPINYTGGFVVRGHVTEDKLSFDPTKRVEFTDHTEADTDVHGIVDTSDLALKSGSITQISDHSHASLTGKSADDHSQYAEIANTETISSIWTYTNDLKIEDSSILAVNTSDIGDSGSGRFNYGYFEDLDINGNIIVGGTVDGINVSSHTHSGGSSGMNIPTSSITSFNSAVDGRADARIESAPHTITGLYYFNTPPTGLNTSGIGNFNTSVDSRVQDVSSNYTIDGAWTFSDNISSSGSVDIGDSSTKRFGTGFFSNLNISGNITVGGLVDGVDVSQLKSDFDDVITGPYIGDGSSLLYIPGTPPDWAGPPPTNIKDAIDRLATAFAGAFGPIV